MVQFYLLSVVANLLAGAILAASFLERRISLPKGFLSYVEGHRSFELAVALSAFAVGICKLIFVTPGDVPVVGDLLPALAGIVLGFTLWLDFSKDRRAEAAGGPFIERCERLFLDHRTAVGLSGIAIALLHFLAPAVLFL